MAQGMTKSATPRGLACLAFRLPIGLYRLRLGWLLGDRLLLTHIGRKSGLPRQAVIEVVRSLSTAAWPSGLRSSAPSPNHRE